MLPSCDFHRRVAARPVAALRVGVLTALVAAAWIVLRRFVWEDPNEIVGASVVLVTACLICWITCSRYLLKGGSWEVTISEGVLRVAFPRWQSQRSFEIPLEDIREIEEEADSEDTLSYRVLGRSGKSYQLPEPGLIDAPALFEMLKTLHPSIIHRVNGEIRAV